MVTHTKILGKDPNTNQPIYDISTLKQKACRTCGAPIYWVVSPKGKRLPVNQWGVSHFTDCPHAKSHSRGSKRA